MRSAIASSRDATQAAARDEDAGEWEDDDGDERVDGTATGDIPAMTPSRYLLITSTSFSSVSSASTQTPPSSRDDSFPVRFSEPPRAWSSSRVSTTARTTFSSATAARARANVASHTSNAYPNPRPFAANVASSISRSRAAISARVAPADRPVDDARATAAASLAAGSSFGSDAALDSVDAAAGAPPPAPTRLDAPSNSKGSASARRSGRVLRSSFASCSSWSFVWLFVSIARRASSASSAD